MKTYPNPNLLSRFCAAAAALLAVLCFAIVPEAKAQLVTNVFFFDDFKRANSTSLGVATNAIDASSYAWTKGGAGGTNNTRTAIVSSNLVISNNSPAGRDFAYVSLTNIAGFNTTLTNSTASSVEWYFNMQQIRPDPSGFDSAQYGAAFVLGASSTNFLGAGVSGYAVVFGQSGATDPLRLVSFTNGITLNSQLANVITATNTGADIGNQYLSIKLSYNPTTSVWAMFGATNAAPFVDPWTNSLASYGSASNSAHVATALPHMGAFWNYSTAGGQTALFDNIRVASVTNSGPPPTGTDYFWAGDGLVLGGSGTWNNSNTNWSVTNSPVLGIAWDASKKAIFAGTAGTVTVDTVSANASIQFSTTGYSLTNGSLTLGGASIGVNTITTDAAVTTTIGTTLAGTAGMTKSGAGTLVLSGANSLSGGIALNSGGLSVSSDGNLGAAGNDVALGGGTLVVTSGFTADSGRDFTGSGTIDIAASQVLQVDGAFNTTAVTLNNTGTLDLNGATRNVGALTFGAAATIDAAGAVTVTSIDATGLASGTALINNAITFSSAGDKTLNVGAGGTVEVAGNISGTTVRIIKTGAGTLEVNGGNDTSGFRLGSAGTTDGGTLVVGSAASMGTNTFQFNYGTLQASAPMTITNDLSIGGRESFVAAVGGANAIEFSGNVSWFSGTGVNHQVNVDNNSTFSGVISNQSSSGTKLVFGGAGTLTMSGSAANSFTNDLILTNTLTVNLNKGEDVTAVAGNVTVNTGATLLISASGQVGDASAVTLSGGTIKRASGVSEVFGTLDLTADSTLDYVGGTSGTLEFGIYEGDLAPDFKLTVNNFFYGNVLIFGSDLSSYISASYTGTAFTSTFFDINSTSGGFTSNWDGSLFTITAIPEPSTYVAAAGLLALMAWPMRRRLVRDAKSVLGLRAPMRDRLARKA